jgi:hypothetical protein
MQLLQDRHYRVYLIVKRLLRSPSTSLEQLQASICVGILGKLRALFKTLKAEGPPALGADPGAFLIGHGV